MGNGIVRGIRDIIYIDLNKFDNLQTIEMQTEIEILNEKMKRENRQYILIGPGRWGSQDRFLGVPVNSSRLAMRESLWKSVCKVSMSILPRVPISSTTSWP
jgi:hypothetical protein